MACSQSSEDRNIMLQGGDRHLTFPRKAWRAAYSECADSGSFVHGTAMSRYFADINKRRCIAPSPVFGETKLCMQGALSFRCDALSRHALRAAIFITDCGA